jgi:hypothetical protein
MLNRFFEWLKERPPLLLAVVLLFIAYTVWIYYRNPVWAIFDGVTLLVIGLLVIFKH